MSDTLTVNLGERSYPIHFSDQATRLAIGIAELSTAGRTIAVVTDSNVANAQAAALKTLFGIAPAYITAPGEDSKSIGELGRVLDFLASSGLDRSSALFAVGGGVVGDLAGFAAASYLRGIDYWQVPTTLLSMVDSSVGGKTGVNLKAGKNLAGAFHQPRGVFIVTGFLASLPAGEFAAGMAEVIKTALLGDGALFAELESSPLTPGDARLAPTIRRCCGIKASLVESDERELAGEGGRALLNLGHTFGHAIENAAGYGQYLHGEAVAIGLCAAAQLSLLLGMIGEADAARVGSAVAAHGLPVRLRAPIPVAALTGAMARDKKVRAGSPRFVLLKSLGEAVVVGGVARDRVEAALRAIGGA